MSIAESRLDRFTFKKGDLKPITDPKRIEELNRKSGFVPMPPEKQAWVSEEWGRRFDMGIIADTNDLEDEYDRRKALGTL